jgi:DNA-binding FadR family transcriptional regulator
VEPENLSEASRPPNPRPSDRVRKVAEVVARMILQDAEELGLGPGDQLMAETKMMEIYSAGRASVREALRILEVQGVVSIRTGRGGGPVLERLKTRDVGDSLKLYLQQRHATYGDVLMARRPLDAHVASLAVLAATAEDLVMLRQIIAELDAVPPGEYRRFGTTSQRYFAAIGAASHNPALALLSQALRDIWSWRVHEGYNVESYWEQGLGRVRQMMLTIESREANVMEQSVLSEHDFEVEFARRHFPDVLDERVRWD